MSCFFFSCLLMSLMALPASQNIFLISSVQFVMICLCKDFLCCFSCCIVVDWWLTYFTFDFISEFSNTSGISLTKCHIACPMRAPNVVMSSLLVALQSCWCSESSFCLRSLLCLDQSSFASVGYVNFGKLSLLRDETVKSSSVIGSSGIMVRHIVWLQSYT